MQDVVFSPISVDELVDRIIQKMNDRSKPDPAPIMQDETGIEDAVEITGYTRATIYRMTWNGTIPCSKLGKRLIFSRRELLEWMKCNTHRKSGISQKVN